jgi:hypothetical protein
VFPLISEATTASRLETLRVVFHSGSSSSQGPTQWPFSLILAAPTLRNLLFKFPRESVLLSTLSLPHLESLDLDLPTISPVVLLGFLRDSAPSLRVCKVRVAAVVESDDNLSSAMNMVVHSSLETFELRVSRGGSGDAISQLLEKLALPNTREVLLEIGHYPKDDLTDAVDSTILPDDLDLSWPHDSFFGFLERASSSVTSLCLGFNPTPPGTSGLDLFHIGVTGAELEEEHVQAIWTWRM